MRGKNGGIIYNVYMKFGTIMRLVGWRFWWLIRLILETF